MKMNIFIIIVAVIALLCMIGCVAISLILVTKLFRK